MPMSFENYSSFAEVEKLYNDVKPMGGKNKTGKDIRPLACRKRSWERIVKISKNCYVLECRFGDVNLTKLYKEKRYTLLTAPIVWRKHRDGTETVTISNGVGQGAHNSHYSFFDRFLPIGLVLKIQNGKQFIVMSSAKNYEPPHHFTPIKEKYYLAKRDVKMYPHHAKFNGRDDGAGLTFKRITGKSRYEFVSGGKPIPKAPRKIVNKKLKAEYKKYIEEFYNYAYAMKPILQFTDTYYGKDGVYGFKECFENRQEVIRDIAWNNESLRNIIRDPDHKFKLNLVIEFLSGTQNVHEPKKFRSSYNRWINRELGFMKEKR